MYEIRGEDVSRLSQADFVDLMNHLLVAECNKLRVPPQNLRFSSEMAAPDDGIDAFVTHSSPSIEEWIPSGNSSWQYKSGKDSSKPATLAGESLKKGVLSVLGGGGYYVIALSVPLSERMRTKREEAVRNALSAEQVPSNRFAIKSGDDIARWSSEHPVLLLLPYFQRGIGSCLRLQDWRKDQRHQGRFVPDDARRKIMVSIERFTANDQKGPVHFRLSGQPGIGKTRLVLASLVSITGIEDRVLYAPDPSSVPAELWAWLRGSKTTSAMIVVDECDSPTAEKLKLQVDACEGRVHLITIGSGSPFTEILSPSHLYLDKLDSAQMRELLQARFVRLGLDQIDWVVRRTGGYVKLAVACAEAIAVKDDADITELMRSDQISEILEALIPDSTDRKVMQAMSILKRVGIDGEAAVEARKLASSANVLWTDFLATISRMDRRGLIGRQGRYRYVTPDLLGQWLATEFFAVRQPDDARALLNELPTPDSKRSFFERLKDMGSDEKTKAVLKDLVSDQAFSNLAALDETRSSFIFEICLGYPTLGLETVGRLVSTASKDELRKFRSGRHYLIMALDYLKWFKESFRQAALLLAALAEAENESYANNATGTWSGLFRLRLGGTEVPIIERLSLLEEFLSGDSQARKNLALAALGELLSPYEIRMSGSETLGTRPVPAEWQPKTVGQMRDAYRSSLKLVDMAMQDQEGSVSKRALAVFLSSARTLVSLGLGDEVITRLNDIVPKNDSDRKVIRETINQITEYEDRNLTDEQKKKFASLEEKVTGNDFRSRIHRWVGPWSLGDWTVGKLGGISAEEQVGALAKEALEKPEQLRTELEWLFTKEALNAGYFGRSLGKLDENRSWLNEIVETTRKGGASALLAGYLVGRADVGDAQFVNDLTERWAGSDRSLVRAILEVTLGLLPSDSSIERLLKLTERGWLPSSGLAQIAWGVWIEKISLQMFRRFVTILLEGEGVLQLQATLHALDRRLEVIPEETRALSDIAWKVLGRPDSVKDSMTQHYWGQIARHYVETDAKRITSVVLRLYEDPDVLLDESDSPMQTLAATARGNPSVVWETVGQTLLGEDVTVYRIQSGLSGWLVDLIPLDLLMSWAEMHQPRGARILASLTRPSGKPLKRLPRELLLKFGEDNRVSGALTRNFLSGTFIGNMSDSYQAKLDLARSWVDDESVRVREWATTLAQGLEDNIQTWKIREEEENLGQ